MKNFVIYCPFYVCIAYEIQNENDFKWVVNTLCNKFYIPLSIFNEHRATKTLGYRLTKNQKFLEN